ncbi:MAG TPA: SUMF1/EgtB/PvdO family nonheme iron enzyme [Candidatus Limnocylindria bacterium]|jgi:formylglycine-generating enzyme required for sulfatase activity|nr:SUMF1/EgtB/PvdO family nonheme iron enzyme [Candidatus Limnocylindria bacterium]
MKRFRATTISSLVLIGLGLLTGCDGGKPTAESTAAATTPAGPKTVKTASGLEMVFIKPGEFIMGVNEGPIDAKPAHLVKVDGFLMDQQEVTQAVYEKLIGMNPSRQKHPKNPVEQTTWTSAVKFCNARSVQEGLTPCYNTETWECNFEASGYRLPTEAEWEYACRAGTTNQYYFGDRAEELKNHAWFEGNSQAKPRPVAHWNANPWGLYDMAGNVSEWCNDFYSPKYYRSSPKENPHGPAEGEKRILRGGAWSSAPENCTSWVRNCDEAGLTDVCLTMDSDGFRCVRKATSVDLAQVGGQL